MGEATLQIIHTIPGRMRVRVPALKENPGYEAVLQHQVETLPAVKAVRISPLARSIAIQYDRNSVSEADLGEQLGATINRTAGLISSSKASTPQKDAPSNYGVVHLTDYEQTQFEQIQRWQHHEISALSEIIGRFSQAIGGWLAPLFVRPLLEKIGATCDAVTANWQQDWQDMKGLAVVEDAVDLRQASLEQCDRLADRVTLAAQEQGMTEGGATALLESVGELLDEGLVLVLALQTIHRIGLCYGYPPLTAAEQVFAWAIFNSALAPTQEQFDQTQTIILKLQRSLYKNALEDETLEDMLEDDLNDRLIASAIEEGVAELTGETCAGVIPVLGIVLGVLANHHLIEQVSTAAKREFQLRWLLENQKVCLLEAAPL